MSDAAVAENEDPVIQWVTFKLDHEIYGINVMQVQEVLRIAEIAPVPGAPDYVSGIINLRGNVVTVLDTRKRFNLPASEQNDSSRIVIVENNDVVVGMMVDSVAEVVELKQSEIEASPNVNNKTGQYIQGVANHDGQLLILIDTEKLVAENKRSVPENND